MKIFLFFLPFILLSCISNTFTGSSKFEASLNMKIKKAFENNDRSNIGIIIKCKEEISEKQIEAIKECGLNIGSVIGKIITAEGTAANIIKLDKLAFIEQVQLAKQNKLLNNQGMLK